MKLRIILVAATAIAAMSAGTGVSQAACLTDGCLRSDAPTQTMASTVIGVTPTTADINQAAAEDQAEGINSNVALKCYHQYAWEYWDTRGGGKLYFYDRVTHWCGRAGVHIYKGGVAGFADWTLPNLWRESDDTWTKGWLDSRHLGVHTTALATLYLDQGGVRLYTKHARLCMDIFANGNAKVTCHN